MKFYLASSSEPVNRRYVAEVAACLEENHGWDCTFAWWENFDADAPAVTQELELMGIRIANIIIGLVDDNSRGTIWELGAGWGLGRKVLVIDRRCDRDKPLPWFCNEKRVRLTPAPLDLSPANMARYIVAEAAMCPAPGRVDEKPA